MNACNIHECHIHGDFLSMSKRKNNPKSQATRFCIVWQTHECQKKNFPNSAPLRSRASSARRKTLLLRLGQATVFEICLSGRCPGDFTVRKAFLIVAVKARGAWMVFRSLPRNATSRAGESFVYALGLPDESALHYPTLKRDDLHALQREMLRLTQFHASASHNLAHPAQDATALQGARAPIRRHPGVTRGRCSGHWRAQATESSMEDVVCPRCWDCAHWPAGCHRPDVRG